MFSVQNNMVVFLRVKQITKGRCGFDSGWSSHWMCHLSEENPVRFASLILKYHVMSSSSEIKMGASTLCSTPSLYTSQYSACVRAPIVLKTCTYCLQSRFLGWSLHFKGSRRDAESAAMGRMLPGPNTLDLVSGMRCEALSAT